MILLFFDHTQALVGSTDQVASLTVTEAAYTCKLTLPAVEFARIGQPDGFVGFDNINGETELYRIMTVDEGTDNGTTSVYAESIGYELMVAPFIRDQRPNGITAATALNLALAGTDWQPGFAPATGTNSTTWYDANRIEVLNDIADKWGVRYGFRVIVTDNLVAAKYVDLYATTPVWRGKRYRLGKDIKVAKRNVDNRELVTALYGRGKGEASGDGYGRRIQFDEVVWRLTDGDPCDKPAGQDYVVDQEATKVYGMMYGLAKFDKIEDPEELLRATWEELQRRKQPKLKIELTVADLERMGYPHEAVRVGDECLVIIDEWGVEALATVSQIERNYTDYAATKVTFGEITGGLAAKVATGAKTWNQAAALNPTGTVPSSALTGALDLVKTQLQSVLTHFHTDETGAFVWTSEDGSSAMRITGAGFEIASRKIGDEWDWQVAATGDGIVATMITTGILTADLIRTGVMTSEKGNMEIDLRRGTVKSIGKLLADEARTWIDSGIIKVMQDGTDTYLVPSYIRSTIRHSDSVTSGYFLGALGSDEPYLTLTFQNNVFASITRSQQKFSNGYFANIEAENWDGRPVAWIYDEKYGGQVFVRYP